MEKYRIYRYSKYDHVVGEFLEKVTFVLGPETRKKYVRKGR